MSSIRDVLWAILLAPDKMLERKSIIQPLTVLAEEKVESSVRHYAQAALRSLESMRSYTGRRNCKYLREMSKAAAHAAIRQLVVEVELDRLRFQLTARAASGPQLTTEQQQ